MQSFAIHEKGENMGIERRVHPRLETIDLVSYENYETTKTELMQGMGKTLDLSVGGVCFLSTYALPLGSQIKISVAIGDDLFEAEGKIVSLNLTNDLQVKIHVQFTDISEENKQLVTDYIEKRSDEPEEDSEE